MAAQNTLSGKHNMTRDEHAFADILQQAQAKDMNSPKVISAREMYHQVARKYGIEVLPLGGRPPNE